MNLFMELFFQKNFFPPTSVQNSRGQQIKVVSMLLRKCRKKGDLVIPTPKRQQNAGDASFEGATVLEPIKGFYKVR